MDLASLRNAPGESVIDSPPRSAPIRSAAAFGPKDIATKGSRPLAKAPDAGPEPALAEWREVVQRTLWRSQKALPLDVRHAVELQHRGIACRRALRLTSDVRSAETAVALLRRDLREQPTLEGVWKELKALYVQLPGALPVAASFAARALALAPKRPKLPAPDQLPRGWVDLTGTDLGGTTVLGVVPEVPPATRARGIVWRLGCVCGKEFTRATWEIQRAQRNGLRLRCDQHCRGIGTAEVSRRDARPTKRRIIDPETLLGEVIGGAEIVAVLPSNHNGSMLQCKCSCGTRFAKSVRELRSAQVGDFRVRCSIGCDGRPRRRVG